MGDTESSTTYVCTHYEQWRGSFHIAVMCYKEHMYLDNILDRALVWNCNPCCNANFTTNAHILCFYLRQMWVHIYLLCTKLEHWKICYYKGTAHKGANQVCYYLFRYIKHNIPVYVKVWLLFAGGCVRQNKNPQWFTCAWLQLILVCKLMCNCFSWLWTL